MTKKTNTVVTTEDQVFAYILAIQELMSVECIIPEDREYAFRIPLQFGNTKDKRPLAGGNHFFMSGQVIVYTPKKDTIVQAVKDEKEAVKLAKAESVKKSKTVKKMSSDVRKRALKTVEASGMAIDQLARMDNMLTAGFTSIQISKVLGLDF